MSLLNQRERGLKKSHTHPFTCQLTRSVCARLAVPSKWAKAGKRCLTSSPWADGVEPPGGFWQLKGSQEDSIYGKCVSGLVMEEPTCHSC